MKIVHIAPNAPYNDYWGYQDNLLPKYHRKLGHDVTVIITNKMHKDGKIIEITPNNYVLNDGVKVYREKYRKFLTKKITEVVSYFPVYDLLQRIHPDFIFYHGLVSTTILDVIKYKKTNPKCVIVQDNHLDDNNFNRGTKDFLFRIWYRVLNIIASPYVNKVYGVTPCRKKFAESYFGIPSSKTDVLIMGADDECIDFGYKERIREEIRGKYNIKSNQFLVVSGGKIDENKKIDVLMEACKELNNEIKLLVFGKIDEKQKEKLDGIVKSTDNIIFVGWIDSRKVYSYFFAADLVVFLGGHSVLWEQACASKVPCVFKEWPGMKHVNNGGNCTFLTDVNVQSVKDMIRGLKYTDKYYEMKRVAESYKTDIFLYSKIAEKSLECARNIKLI